MKKLKLMLFILLFVVSGSVFAASSPEYRKQALADEMVQNAIYYLWNDGDVKKAEKEFFKGITIQGRLDLVEQFFRKASEQQPDRLDLMFSVASVEVLEGKVKEAVGTYDGILKKDPGNFNAAILRAAYLKCLNKETEYNDSITKLKGEEPDATLQYLEIINNIEKNFKLKLISSRDGLAPDSGVTAIVILGYALDKDGTMMPTLIKRLEKGLEAASVYKDAKIVVSGGVPRQGVCESFLMKKWLAEHGISPDRVIIEDKSKDTVGNAQYSLDILKALGSHNALVITSASHIRRAVSIFEEGARAGNMDIKFSDLVYMDYDKPEDAYKVSDNEKLAIYRDVFRMSGIWSYPGVQK